LSYLPVFIMAMLLAWFSCIFFCMSAWLMPCEKAGAAKAATNAVATAADNRWFDMVIS